VETPDRGALAMPHHPTEASVQVPDGGARMRPPHAAAAERDVLLATKLHVPQPRPGFLPRPRLTERLTEATALELVLVCTPAGFGKTTLLGDWARHSQRPVAWLSLDQGDNDPARFWRHVAAALERVCPGIAEQVAGLLGPPAPPSFEGLMTALVNELAAQPEPVLLVLDDYHLVDAQPVHASVGFLVEHLPPGLRLVLASRADPPLPLARLRARGQLAELRERDLRFTAEEATALLRAVVGPDLPDAAVTALAARTEGWAAGLQLAILSLRGQADVAGFVEEFSGSHRYVLDYLTEEVLDRQPDQVRSFLLETSVLERLSGELCDTVTGRADGQAMLEQVERANLFLVPLDEVRGWWRYHRLFADLLRARLAREQPERLPRLHRVAAAWHEQHGLIDDAVPHAMAAGDTLWTARLLERHLDELLLRGENATVDRWLRALPAELAGARPRLLLTQARLALNSGRLEAVDGLLDAAERAFAAAADEPYEPSVGRAASLLVNVPAAIAQDRAFLAVVRGDAEQASAFARRALAGLDEGEWLLGSIARGHLAMAEWLRGRLPEAERALASTIARWRAAGERFLAIRFSELLGYVQRGRGRLDAALATFQGVLEIAAAPGRPALPAAGMAYVAMAEIAYQRGELAAALEHVTKGIELCRRFVEAPALALGLVALAWIRQAQGDPAGALEAMDEAERAAPSPNVTALLNPVPAQRARLALAHGEVADAARWTNQRGLDPDDEPSHQQEPEHLVLARVLLAEQAPERALGLLERLHDLAAGQGRVGSVIEIRALQALALADSGDERGALAALAEALRLGAPEGYLRVFVDEGAPMANLLGRLAAPDQRVPYAAAEDAPPDYLARLLASFPPTATGTSHPAGRARAGLLPGLVEPLSERELQVLALLATGRSNQQIAEELVVALDTVKKHVSHVLDKLGVANRTQAVARARELELLR
jgi:LuxR family transcriptional regulator, maltose regulon positive regulatory protein